MQPFPTRRPPEHRLLIFARVPELGLVKTRLAAALGAERTLEVYEAMLRDLLKAIGPSDDELEIEVLWTGSDSVDGRKLRSAFGQAALAVQTGATLGERLSIAFAERFFFHSTRKVIAIGVDDPSLTRSDINRAIALLDSCEWVIGPASDGGYYLIGCRAEAFRSEIFQGIEWGTSSVLRTTTEKIRRNGATLASLPTHSDIDVLDDLQTFSRGMPSHTQSIRETVTRWGWPE